MSAIERNRINGSSFVATKPRRDQKRAASLSTALTIRARPPISDAAWTQRQQRGARLSMIFKDGTRLEQEVTAVPGDAQMPFTLQALSDKFFVYCDGSLSVDESARVLDHCLNAPPQAKPFSFWNYPQEITPC